MLTTKRIDIYIPLVVFRVQLRAMLAVSEDPDDSKSSPMFKNIAIDSGKFARLIRSRNLEYEVVFSAVFIHFVNV